MTYSIFGSYLQCFISDGVSKLQHTQPAYFAVVVVEAAAEAAVAAAASLALK